jgi:hypothetical protein
MTISYESATWPWEIYLIKQYNVATRCPASYSMSWWLTYPSEKYESVGMMKFPIYGKIIHSCSSHHQSGISCSFKAIFNFGPSMAIDSAFIPARPSVADSPPGPSEKRWIAPPEAEWPGRYSHGRPNARPGDFGTWVHLGLQVSPRKNGKLYSWEMIGTYTLWLFVT